METVDLQKARRLKTKAEETPVIYRRMADIKPEAIMWLWKERIACGKISMIAGDPGLGKSQLTSYMAAKVTTGGIWPDGTPCKAGNVIFLSAEDDPADTGRPRLEAVGANLSRVYILDAVRENGDAERSFNLKTDLERLSALMDKIGNVTLVIIDPITAYLGQTDSHKNSDVRALLAPLSELASRHKAAIVCVSHLNKGGSSQALMRMQGSIAFVAAARAAYIVAKDQDNPERRLFLPIKNNIGNDQTGFGFAIVSHMLDNGIQTSRVEFEAEPVTVRADDALITDNDERTALDDAKEFLRETLGDNEVPVKGLRKQADDAGHSWPTIRRAANQLGIEKHRTGFGKEGSWGWKFPKVLKQPIDAPDLNVSTYEGNEHLCTANESDEERAAIQEFDGGGNE